MPRNITSQTIDLPPPYGGFMDRLPVAAIQHPYCQQMVNWNSDAGTVSLRKGDKLYKLAIDSTQTTTSLVTSGNKKLFLVTLKSGVGAYYQDVSDFTTTITTTALTRATASVITLVLGAEFCRRSFFFNLTAAGVESLISYDPQTAASTVNPYTFSDVTFIPAHGCPHKNRLFMISRTDFRIAYSGVSLIAGAATVEDYASIFSQNGQLVASRSVSLSTTTEAQVILILLSSSGELIGYAGSYPGSSDWTLVGRFFLSLPKNYDCIIDRQGDALIITAGGVVSVRQLFTEGSDAADSKAVTAPIVKRWKQLSSAATVDYGANVGNGGMLGVWDSLNNRLVLSFTNWVDAAGVASPSVPRVGPDFLIYNYNTQAWIEHVGRAGASLVASVVDVSYFQDKVIYTCDSYPGVWIKEGKTNYLDDYAINTAGQTALATTTYTALILSAPLPLSKTAQKLLTSLQLISKTDMESGVKITMVGDFGAITSGTNTQPDQGTGVVSSEISIGIDATFIQYVISTDGTTNAASTLGCELYAISPRFTQGGIG